MKKITKTVLACLSISAVVASTPVEKLVPISNVFSPAGFDSNDNVEIIVEGLLPNLCHRNPMKKVSITGNKIDIKITALDYHESNPYCPEMVVPFLEKVDVGVLDKGDYDILVNGKTIYQKSGSIRVEESTSTAIDDAVYANVDYIVTKEGSRQVLLKGYNPSDCFVLDEIKVSDNKNDVYSIQPKMKQISDFCPMKMVPFKYELEVPKGLNKEKVLLHVRVMDGQSVNSLFLNK